MRPATRNQLTTCYHHRPDPGRHSSFALAPLPSSTPFLLTPTVPDPPPRCFIHLRLPSARRRAPRARLARALGLGKRPTRPHLLLHAAPGCTHTVHVHPAWSRLLRPARGAAMPRRHAGACARSRAAYVAIAGCSARRQPSVEGGNVQAGHTVLVARAPCAGRRRI